MWKSRYTDFELMEAYRSEAEWGSRMRFRPGDIVRYVGDNHLMYGESAIIKSFVSATKEHEVWKIEFDSFLLGDYEARDDELKIVTRKPLEFKNCQCGAHAQKGFENFHSDWCPMYHPIELPDLPEE